MVAIEQYNIDGCVYNKTDAIDYFKKTRILLHATLTVATEINSESGFRITFS